MTYMFDNPTYNRVALPKNIEILYRRYALYSYCEGTRCDAHRRKLFTGIKIGFFLKTDC